VEFVGNFLNDFTLLQNMDMLPKCYIRSSSVKGQFVGKNLAGIITEVDLKNHPDFAFILLAIQDEQLLGYAGFIDNFRSSLVEVEPSLLELKMLNVDFPYFQRGVATALLDYSHALSQERGRRLILRPERPFGGYVLKGGSIEPYPLETKELHAMYMRHEFRQFTPLEVDDLARKLDEHYLVCNLWGTGINPETAQMTDIKRYSYDPKEVAERLFHISFEDKLHIWAEVLIRQYGNASALDSNRKHHREKVEAYLVAE
jgi:hypothetical protein